MSSFDNLIDFFALGGPVVIVLFLLSIFALYMVTRKFIQFFRTKAGYAKPIENAIDLWLDGYLDKAIETLSPLQSASAQSIKMAMVMRKEGGFQTKEIENAVVLVAKRNLHKLHQGIKILDAITQVAPLIGLFGTVLGMIEAFQTLQAAGSAVNPSQLAGGIWVALLTTALGLLIAIPVSAFVTWLETRLENEQILIELNGEIVIMRERPMRKFDADTSSQYQAKGQAASEDLHTSHQESDA